MDRVAFAEQIAERWNREEICYAVAHGIDDWPHRLGRDLDVVVAARDAMRAIRLARETLEGNGLCVANPPPLWGDRLVAADRQRSDDLLEIHTTTRIAWRYATIVARPEPSLSVGPFAIDPWIAVAKRTVLPLLAGQTHVLRADPGRLALTDAERVAAHPRLTTLVGRALADELLSACAGSDSDTDAIERLVSRMRRAVLRRATLDPLGAAALTWLALTRRLRQPWMPCAPIVAVLGDRDTSARTMLRFVADADRLIFTGLVLRSPGRGASVLAQLLRDRIDSSRQRLVLYDGLPYGGSTGRLPRLLRAVPDLTIVIGDATATPRIDGTIAVLAPDLDRDQMGRRAIAAIIESFMTKNGAPQLAPDG